jgi:hypothetical protein
MSAITSLGMSPLSLTCMPMPINTHEWETTESRSQDAGSGAWRLDQSPCSCDRHGMRIEKPSSNRKREGPTSKLCCTTHRIVVGCINRGNTSRQGCVRG